MSTIDVKTEINGFEIIQSVSADRNEIMRLVADTREAQIIQALVYLGWTPPKRAETATSENQKDSHVSA